MPADNSGARTDSVSRRESLQQAAVLGTASCGTLALARSAQAAGSDVIWDVDPPIKPGADGHYPAILPGITKLG